MGKFHINVEPSDAHHQLELLAIGGGTVLEAVVDGIPSDCADVQIHFKDPADNSFTSFLCEPLAGGRWAVAGAAVPIRTPADYQYHVTAVDRDGKSRWFGQGVFRIMPSLYTVVPGSGGGTGGTSGGGIVCPFSDDGEILVRNRTTGRLHRLYIENDEDGNPVPVWDSDPEENADAEGGENA